MHCHFCVLDDPVVVLLRMTRTSMLKFLHHPESILYQAINEDSAQFNFVVTSFTLHLHDIFPHFINRNLTSNQNRCGTFFFNKPVRHYLQVTFISKKVIGISGRYSSLNGIHLAESHAVCVFFDLEKRKTLSLPKHIQQQADLIKQLIVPQRIQAIQRTTEEAIHKVVNVREEHIDMNNHTSLGCYITWALEAFKDLHNKTFPRESSCNIAEIQTLNERESLLGDELHISAWFDTKLKTCNCTITAGGHLVMFLKGRYASSELAKL